MAEMVFDAALRERLVAFQRAHGLAEDGIAATKTWAKLAEITPGAAKREPEISEPFAITPEEFPELFALAQACRDEAGFKAMLVREVDLDLDEILANIDAVLES
jgi:hypothetical protein